MGLTYAMLGAGRQNLAAAYDLARFGQADRLVLVDISAAAAEAAAERINLLTGRALAVPEVCDLADLGALRRLFTRVDAAISGAHYGLNLAISRLAIETRTHLTDFGGHTGIVRQQLALDADASRAGVTVVPDCGMGPGLNVSLALHAMSLVDTPREVRIWDGGLPQAPEPPWHYRCMFALPGLTNEYDGHATFLRDGQLTEVPCFADVESIDFPPPIGRLEAFVTSGGLSTAPWTLQGTLTRLENKTLRYPGHVAQFRAFADLGLLGTDPIEVGTLRVAPRDLFHALLEPRIGAAAHKDVCVMRVACAGETGGRPAEAVVELVDWFDEPTGLSAMQRLTGWHASIMLIAGVEGRIPAGVVSVERALAGPAVVEDARRRGLVITERVRLE